MQGRRLESVLDLLCSRVSYSLPSVSVLPSTDSIKIGAETPVFMVFHVTPTYEELFDLRQLLSVLKTIGESPSWVDADIEVESETVINGTISLEGSENTVIVETLCSKSQYLRKSNLGWVESILSSKREIQPISEVNYNLAGGFVQPRKSLKVVHFSLESKNLPEVTGTLSVAETVRRKLMGISRKLYNGDLTKVSLMFSGKNRDGSPSTNHQHAFFLPFSTNKKNTINELIVTTTIEFTEHDIEALRRLTSLPPDITISLKNLSTTPILNSKVWVSATPFVSMRHHRKSRGDWKEWMKNELLKEILHRELQPPLMIEMINRKKSKFATTRKNMDSRNLAFFKLTYSQNVSGPFSLGSLAHFGIGLFLPEEDNL